MPSVRMFIKYIICLGGLMFAWSFILSANNLSDHNSNNEQTFTLDNRNIDRISMPRSRHLNGRTEKEKVNFDFEDLSNWNMSVSKGIEAKFTRSKEEPLWGDYVGRLELKRLGNTYKENENVMLFTTVPLDISEDFDSINIWTFSPVWNLKIRPQLMMTFIIDDVYGVRHEFPMRSVDQGWLHWHGWSIWHKSLPKAVKAPAKLLGIRFDGINEKSKVLYFDSLRFYKRSCAPLQNARVPSWKELGIPIRPETILPTPSNRPSPGQIEKTGDFSYALSNNTGTPEELRFEVELKSGTLSDIKAVFHGSSFFPAFNGGFYWTDGKKKTAPGSQGITAALKGSRIDGSKLIAEWIYHVYGHDEKAEWQLELKNNTLIISLSSEGGNVYEVKAGAVNGINGNVTEVPYLALRGWRHKSEGPGIFCGNGIYVSEFFDWYNSDASELFGECSRDDGGSWQFVPSEGDMRWIPNSGTGGKNEKSAQSHIINGGAFYGLKTDGSRNPVRERLFISVDSRFDAVLPNIPNPPHRYLTETVNDVWATRMLYEPVPKVDVLARELEMWKMMYAYGARNLNVRYHCDLFRVYYPHKNGDPMTFIEDIDPNIGGDAAVKKLFAGLKKLGFRAGLYTDHTLLAPLAYDIWDENYLTRNSQDDWVFGSDGHLQVKNSMMYKLQRRYNKVFKEKFAPNCGYLDQLTCPPPWRYTDFDSRAPESGKFSAAYRAFVESLREEMADFGPVLSEGMSQWMFAGICDSYAQPTRLEGMNLLPDFQLRKLHELSNDCGYHLSLINYKGSGFKPEEKVHTLLCYEYAYGNTGHIYGGYHGSPFAKIPDFMIKSYFMIQPFQKFYALVPIKEILYNVNGELAPIEKAIAKGTLGLDQIKLTYDNNAEVAVNLNQKLNYEITVQGRKFLLPPNGFVFSLPDKALSYSSLMDGKRIDFAKTPEIFYIDNLGYRRCLDELTASEAYIIHHEDDGIKVVPAPFRKQERIRINLKAFLPKSEIGKFQMSALDANDNIISEFTIDAQDFVDIDILKDVFAWRLKLIKEL